MKKLTALLSLALALPLAAQEPPMPQPTAEHHKLAEQIGTWDAVIEMTGPDGTPMKEKGVSRRQMPMGPFWLHDQFQSEFMGMKFKGHGTTGYDPHKKKYVGTWIDSMTPTLMVTEGNWDKTGKVLTMVGMGVDMQGKPARHRFVTTVENRDAHTFEMFVGPEGKDVKMMTIHYTRRVPKRDTTGGR
ncbi:MAG TPA: DUF1579 domain-containing protein [bacterium]|nr:DUF1579 domain-containing protein [bacterium]